MKKIGIHVLLIASLASHAGCGKKPASSAQGDPSPPEAVSETQAVAETRAVAEKFKSALSQRDWTTALSCMDEESQAMFVGTTVMMAQLLSTSADESEKKSLDALLRRHGIEERPKGDATMKMPLKSMEKTALVGDLFAWFEKNQPPAAGTTRNGITIKGGGSPIEDIARTEFSDFKIDGGTASATSTTSMGTRKPFYFKRVEGKWYIDFATTMRKGMENLNRPPSKKGP